MVLRDNGGVRKRCECDYIHCDKKSNPLCGRDGRSYTSVCELQRAECLAGAPIGIQHFDACMFIVLVSHCAFTCTACIQWIYMYDCVQVECLEVACVICCKQTERTFEYAVIIQPHAIRTPS